MKPRNLQRDELLASAKARLRLLDDLLAQMDKLLPSDTHPHTLPPAGETNTTNTTHTAPSAAPGTDNTPTKHRPRTDTEPTPPKP